MKRVRRTRTAPEQVVAGALRELGLGYRRNVATLPGSPDFANRRKAWAIFVMGCYWHGHRGCAAATLPTRNREFWAEKFITNRRRDARKIRALRALGFRVLVVWECTTRSGPEAVAAALRSLLPGGSTAPPERG